MFLYLVGSEALQSCRPRTGEMVPRFVLASFKFSPCNMCRMVLCCGSIGVFWSRSSEHLSHVRIGHAIIFLWNIPVQDFAHLLTCLLGSVCRSEYILGLAPMSYAWIVTVSSWSWCSPCWAETFNFEDVWFALFAFMVCAFVSFLLNFIYSEVTKTYLYFPQES